MAKIKGAGPFVDVCVAEGIRDRLATKYGHPFYVEAHVDEIDPTPLGVDVYRSYFVHPFAPGACTETGGRFEGHHTDNEWKASQCAAYWRRLTKEPYGVFQSGEDSGGHAYFEVINLFRLVGLNTRSSQ